MHPRGSRASMSLLVVAVQWQRHALRRRPAGRFFFHRFTITSESILGEGWLYNGLAAEAACSPPAQSLRFEVLRFSFGRAFAIVVKGRRRSGHGASPVRKLSGDRRRCSAPPATTEGIIGHRFPAVPWINRPFSLSSHYGRLLQTFQRRKV